MNRVREALRHWQKPALVVWGAEDRVLPLSVAKMFVELLPNLWSTIIVFFTLNIANNMLFEAGLSYLGVGVQPPNSSWGTMIATGNDLITSAPLLTIIPGTMILLTDGRIMVQEEGTAHWHALSPDAHGSYLNGTWSTLHDMSGFRRYYASAVLNNGRVLIESTHTDTYFFFSGS